ncbi:MAG: hypothetical protein EX254_11645, partial [Flavobacteriaceae bacterium]
MISIPTLKRPLLSFLLFFFSFNIISSQCPTGQIFNNYCYDDNEVDNVAFEVCPTAGMAVQSDIIQGSFFVGTGDNLTVYSGTSGSGTSGVIVFGPMGGNLMGTMDIESLGADQCLIFVINSNTFGAPVSCADGTELELQVCSVSIPVAAVTFTAPADLCINAGVQTGLGGGFPTGGVYSGAGVTDDGNGMTYSFDPAAAGVGTITITYTNGVSASDDVEVFAVPTVSFSAPTDLCIDAGIMTGLGGGTPVGGVYSGPGVTDNGNGLTYSFNPVIAGLGMHTITYTEGICGASAMDIVEVLAACGCPSGELTYFNCYDNNETDLVIFEVCPNAGEFSKATISQGTYGVPDDALTVYQGVSGTGIGGTIVFGPSD